MCDTETWMRQPSCVALVPSVPCTCVCVVSCMCVCVSVCVCVHAQDTSVMCDIETLMASAHNSMSRIAEKVSVSCCITLHRHCISAALVQILCFSVREMRESETTKLRKSRHQVAELINKMAPCSLSHGAELESMLMLPMYKDRKTI